MPSPRGPAGTATCTHPDNPTLPSAGARGLSVSLPFPPGLHQGQPGVLEQACNSTFAVTWLWKVSINPSPLLLSQHLFSSVTYFSAGGPHVWPDGCGVRVRMTSGCLGGIRTSLSPCWLGRAQHQWALHTILNPGFAQQGRTRSCTDCRKGTGPMPVHTASLLGGTKTTPCRGPDTPLLLQVDAIQLQRATRPHSKPLW